MPPDVGSWWRARLAATTSTPAQLFVFESLRHPDGTCLELTAAEASALTGSEQPLATATFDEHGRVTRIETAPDYAPRAPALWLAEVRESTAHPPATNLIAFCGFGIAAGVLLDEAAVVETEARSEDQLGAVRWYPATGEIDQIYVAPSARRRGIASVLLVSAGTLAVARDWPRLWSDGQRTLLGDRLRESRAWRWRAADLTHVAPPMTPGEG